MKKLMYFLLIILIFQRCNQVSKSVAINEKTGWRLVFKNDKKGKTLFGSKEKLRAIVRKGYPIRIGFGEKRPNDTLKSIEHFVDAKFLTISNSREVFAQIDPIIGQNPNLDSDTLNIKFRENLQWNIIVGSNGFSDRLTTDRFKDTIVGHRRRPMSVSWFVKFPINN